MYDQQSTQHCINLNNFVSRVHAQLNSDPTLLLARYTQHGMILRNPWIICNSGEVILKTGNQKRNALKIRLVGLIACCEIWLEGGGKLMGPDIYRLANSDISITIIWINSHVAHVYQEPAFSHKNGFLFKPIYPRSITY
jgi:hypothetical protein